MIRFLFRFLGILLLALAFIFVIYDGVKSIADSMLYITRTEQFWSEIHGRSLLVLRAGVERHAAALWRWAIQPLLDQPIELVFGVLGAILILFGRKKKPPIGYGRD